MRPPLCFQRQAQAQEPAQLVGLGVLKVGTHALPGLAPTPTRPRPRTCTCTCTPAHRTPSPPIRPRQNITRYPSRDLAAGRPAPPPPPHEEAKGTEVKRTLARSKHFGPQNQFVTSSSSSSSHHYYSLATKKEPVRDSPLDCTVPLHTHPHPRTDKTFGSQSSTPTHPAPYLSTPRHCSASHLIESHAIVSDLRGPTHPHTLHTHTHARTRTLRMAATTANGSAPTSSSSYPIHSEALNKIASVPLVNAPLSFAYNTIEAHPVFARPYVS